MKDQTRPLLQDFQWLCDTSRVPLVKTKHPVPVTFPVPAAKWTPKFVLVMSRACVSSTVMLAMLESYSNQSFHTNNIVFWTGSVCASLHGLCVRNWRSCGCWVVWMRVHYVPDCFCRPRQDGAFAKLSWKMDCIFETLRLPCPHTGFAKMASQSWLHCMNLVISPSVVPA